MQLLTDSAGRGGGKPPGWNGRLPGGGGNESERGGGSEPGGGGKDEPSGGGKLEPRGGGRSDGVLGSSFKRPFWSNVSIIHMVNIYTLSIAEARTFLDTCLEKL